MKKIEIQGIFVQPLIKVKHAWELKCLFDCIYYDIWAFRVLHTSQKFYYFQKSVI